MRVAVFPGSFDPITNGHVDIVQRALPLFDKIIIAVGVNSLKSSMFDLEQRQEWIKETFPNNPKIEVGTYEKLTVDYCQKMGANFILRGLRNPADFEFEKSIAHTNRKLNQEVETVFLLTGVGLSAISSSIVRDVVVNGGDYTSFVPEAVKIELA